MSGLKLAIRAVSLFISLTVPAQAAMLVVPNPGVKFIDKEKIKIIAIMKATFGLRGSGHEHSEEELKGFFGKKESEYLKQKFEEAKLPVTEVKRIPDVIFDLWAIQKIVRDPRSFQHHYELKGENTTFRDFYFDISSELMTYLESQTKMQQALESILVQFGKMNRPQDRDFSELYDAIINHQDFLLEALQLEEDAIQNDHYLFWRGTNGFFSKETLFLDLPLREYGTGQSHLDKLLFSDETIDISNFSIPDFSFGNTLFGGSLFDGFARGNRSASAFVYHGLGSQFLYVLSIPRKNFMRVQIMQLLRRII
jgi:hypothetical protein